MKKYILLTAVVGVLALLVVSVALGQTDGTTTEKRAQTGMKFLSVSLDARSAGMGNAMTANDQFSSMAMFYNPASMGFLDEKANVAVGRASWIVDINYNYGAVAVRPSEGKYGIFGLNVVAVDYGDFEGTIRSDNEAGYESLGTFSPSALSVGLAYSLAVSDRFSFGGNAKYVNEDLGSAAVRRQGSSVQSEEYSVNTFAFDFGILYKTGFKSLNFGMTARNFASDVKYNEDSFELPLTFRIGLSMNLIDFTSMNKDKHSFLFSVDTERPRDFEEHVNLGAEYMFSNLLSLRGGYAITNSNETEEGFSVGGGLKTKLGAQGGLRLDYAYTEFGVFDNVNRFTFSFAF